MTLSEKSLNEIESIKQKYPDKKSATLPALYIAQREFGSLTLDAIEAVADSLNLPKSHIRGVATFYSMYKNKPKGRHLIQLCTNVACMIFGAEELVALLKNKYGVEVGGTSPDGRFSLVIMECIGGCDVAPAMLVNDDYHGKLTETNIIEILEKYK